MVAWPTRGQKSPNFWDAQLKTYVDDADVAATAAAATAGGLAYATKATQTTVESGRLSDASLSAAIAAKAGTTLIYTPVYNGFFAGQTSATDSTVPTRWANSTHLTNTALRAWADYIVAQANAQGAFPTGSPKIVWFGDSWVQTGAASILSAATLAVIPTATVVVSGVGGNTSQSLVDRFATDVPADAKVVIFNEPGVNDAAGAITVAKQLDNLVNLTRKIRALNATPVFTGHVPLTDYPLAATYHSRLTEIIGTGKDFLGAAGTQVWKANTNTPATDSMGLNPTALANPSATGLGNLMAGYKAGAVMTTARYSTGIGAYALQSATTTVEATAVGSYALASQTTGNYNTAIGTNAGRSVTTGTQNTFVGPNAGYADVTNATANAITDGNENTFIGNWSYPNSASTSSATAVGARTKAGSNATAIGWGTVATNGGSVAIGRDGAGLSAQSIFANYFVVGTTNHIVQVQGYLRIDRSQTTIGAAGAASAPPANPSRYFIVRGDDGVDYAVPGYAKV